jgi:hypothetical protein
MTTEIIEGEAVEVEPQRALAVVPDPGMTATGPLALAGLSDEEFERRLTALDTMRTRVARMQKALMVLDVDYGTIPGTPKPTLLKPGAEKLCQAYGLAADFMPERIVGDGIAAPALSYQTRCDLYLGSLSGLVVAVGYGSANSWERKHRYRRGERTCPACGKVGTIIKGKAEYGGGWVCWKKKDGCDAKWPDGTAEIEAQAVGDVENPDPWDLDTTLLKMAEKRAFVDATLRATAASGLFTQDVEDQPRDEAPPAPPAIERFDGGLFGIASLGSMAPVDGEYREGAEGPAVGFVIGEGRQRVQVVAWNALADVLAPLIPDIIGQRVQCFGAVSNETMTVGSGAKKHDVGFQRLTLTRLVTPDWILPADEAAAEALWPKDDDLSDLDF